MRERSGLLNDSKVNLIDARKSDHDYDKSMDRNLAKIHAALPFRAG
tara:strand:- start:232 stop:369 length:138 start_codon:yes stop_codon:yes gene_type:complete